MEKIAVLFSGQPRQVDFCSTIIKKTLGFLDAEIDYFAHSYNEISVKSLNSADDGIKNIKKLEINEVENLYKNNYPITDIKVTDYTEVLKYKQYINSIVNVYCKDNKVRYTLLGGEPDSVYLTWMGNMYSSQVVNDLKKKHEKENNFKYDLVVKLRSDIVFHDAFLNMPNVTKRRFLEKCNKGGVKHPIFVTYIQTKGGRIEVGDFIKWGPSESFDILLNDVIKNYYNLVLESILYYNKHNNNDYKILGLNNIFDESLPSPESQWAYMGMKSGVSYIHRPLGTTLARYNVTKADNYDQIQKKARDFLNEYGKTEKPDEWMKNNLV